MKVNRLLTTICSKDLERSKLFYTSLFDFTVPFESDWFISLISEEQGLELGIIDHSHELVPVEYQISKGGFYMTFVVEELDKVYLMARIKGYEIIEEPNDTFYGQRRFLLRDPDGSLVDVSQPIPGFFD